MTQADAVNYWLTSARRNHQATLDMFKAGHYDWSLYMWHLVIEKTFKAVISNQGSTPVPTHNLTKLAKQAKLKLSNKNQRYLKEITSFNLEARYDDYKFSFYHKATIQFARKWADNCEKIYLELAKLCPQQ